MIKKKPIINEAIPAGDLHVIHQDGHSLGILSKQVALRLARESNLDLIIVDSNQKTPPIAKIADWGKYSYQKKKKQQQNRQAQLSKTAGLKQMRFNVKIGNNDLSVKLRKVGKFLEEGNKVKLTIFLRGREMQHKDLALALAQDIINRLADDGVVEQTPRFSGRQINMIIRKKV